MSASKHPEPTVGARHVLEPTSVGRYLVFDEIGVGGMASVHLGLMSGAVGFQRIVAIKQLHPQFVNDPDFCAQFVDEARLAARIHHPNVVQTLDVVWIGDELALVLEYLDGDTLSRVLKTAIRRDEQVPIDIACGVMCGVLHGLHAAHDAKDEQGKPLNIVHRDVSPQNILIGRDGLARVLDFGVARAAARIHTTQAGLIKGKFGYMAPEQIKRGQVDRRTDVFAAGIVLWETLTRRRLFQPTGKVEKVLDQIVSAEVDPPSTFRSQVPKQLDAIVAKALSKEPEARFQTAEEFAVSIEQAIGAASPHLVKTWFAPFASEELAQRAKRIEVINRRYASRPEAPSRQSSKRSRTRSVTKPTVEGTQITRRDAVDTEDSAASPSTTRAGAVPKTRAPPLPDAEPALDEEGLTRGFSVLPTVEHEQPLPPFRAAWSRVTVVARRLEPGGLKLAIGVLCVCVMVCLGLVIGRLARTAAEDDPESAGAAEQGLTISEAIGETNSANVRAKEPAGAVDAPGSTAVQQSNSPAVGSATEPDKLGLPPAQTAPPNATQPPTNRRPVPAVRKPPPRQGPGGELSIRRDR